MERGVELAWRNLEVRSKITSKEKKQLQKQGKPVEDKVILTDMTGKIQIGSFTAIMGASGSGKTTFLNFLSNRKYYLKTLIVNGEFLVNGRSIDTIDFNRITGYAMQDDIILDTLTVREVLLFTAKLRLSKDIYQARMDEVISDLELFNCADSIVGNVGKKGISGGERKRTSIAIELLTDPSLLFLDEPTTGLDSYNAEHLIDLLRHLSTKKITVVCTIHQPNSIIFSKFDQLMLLAAQTTIYHGSARGALDFFKDAGHPCHKYANPAEHFIYLLSPIGEDYQERIDKIKSLRHKPELEIQDREIPQGADLKTSSFGEELWALMKRSGLNLFRAKMLVLFKVIANFVFVLFLFTSFWGIGDDHDAKSVLDRAGFLFFLMVYQAFGAVSSSGAYAEEKAMFIREQANKTYSPTAYYLSKLIVDMPIDLLISTLVTISLYYAVGLDDDPERLWILVLIIIIINANARGWGNFLIISIPNVQAAAAASPFVIILQVMFGGLFINYDDIPDYLIPLHYISIVKWCWSAAIFNEFDDWDEERCGLDPRCDPEDFFSLPLNLWYCILIAFCITIVVHILAYLSLIRLARQFRN
jgi:ATP-binding cassette subfamily G (WHITE) protein 1